MKARCVYCGRRLRDDDPADVETCDDCSDLPALEPAAVEHEITRQLRARKNGSPS